MATLCRPVHAWPEHVITVDQLHEHVATVQADHPRINTILRVMRSTQVRTRRSVVPFHQLVDPPTLGERMELYLREAVALSVRAATKALQARNMHPDDIDAVVTVSVTGHAVPSIDAHLINELGLRRTVRRYPVSQMGCAGGAYAVARAAGDLMAHRGDNVLIVAVELASLSYHQRDVSIASFVANALFGDAAIACVVHGDDGPCGPVLGPCLEHLLPGTLSDVTYTLDEHGHHFVTTPVVREVVRDVVPDLVDFLERTNPVGWRPEWIASHTGGPKVLEALVGGLGCDPDLVRHSYASLRERGNVASASVLDVLWRAFADPPADGARGLIIGFGPGFTSVAIQAVWNASSSAGVPGDVEVGVRPAVAVA